MDLIVKVKSYRNLDNYIKMGANAFLFGIKDFSINSLTNLNIRKLKKIKDKYKNIKIYISVDKNMFNKDLDKLTKFLINVDNLNLDGIFFYDLGIYYIKEKYNLKTPLVWNQNYFVNNYETCNYYYSKGIKYGVISNEITKEEIEKIVKNTKMNMFINVFGYQMMSYSKRKLVSNYFRFLKRLNFKKYHKLIENKRTFIIKEEKYGTCFLSDYVLCYVNYLNYFKSIGVKGVILNEELIDKDIFLNIIKMYKENIDDENNYYDKIKKLIPNIDLGFLNTKTIYKVKTR